MFRRYLSREIDQWSKRGLLQPGQAEKLLADHDQRHTGFHLSGVLAVLAAVLFGAAVVALVAANWEAIARPVRVGMIFVFIMGGLAAAAQALRHGSGWISEALLVFVLLCHGAGIALVAQMYHLSGDEAAFMLTWTIGALVVAIGYSSSVSAIITNLLGLGYFIAEAGFFDFGGWSEMIDPAGYATVIGVAIAGGVSAYRAGSAVAGHLTAWMVIGWLLWIGDALSGWDAEYLLAVIGVVVFLAGSFAVPATVGAHARHGSISTYGAVMAFSGLGWIQVDLPQLSLAMEIGYAALVLVASVAVLVVAGGENPVVRRVAYFAFAAETLYVVAETLGSLLGSAGFLFLGGLVLAVVAYVVTKLEKRFGFGGKQR